MSKATVLDRDTADRFAGFRRRVRQRREVSQSGSFVPASSSPYSRTDTPTSHDARAMRSPFRSRSRLSIVANIATSPH